MAAVRRTGLLELMWRIHRWVYRPTHPAWLLNLRANPNVSIQIGRQTMPARAREATGEERSRLWQQVVEIDGAYAVYERRTRRRIPVVVLEPLSSAGSA